MRHNAFLSSSFPFSVLWITLLLIYPSKLIIIRQKNRNVKLKHVLNNSRKKSKSYLELLQIFQMRLLSVDLFPFHLQSQIHYFKARTNKLLRSADKEHKSELQDWILYLACQIVNATSIEVCVVIYLDFCFGSVPRLLDLCFSMMLTCPQVGMFNRMLVPDMFLQT